MLNWLHLFIILYVTFSLFEIQWIIKKNDKLQFVNVCFPVISGNWCCTAHISCRKCHQLVRFWSSYLCNKQWNVIIYGHDWFEVSLESFLVFLAIQRRYYTWVSCQIRCFSSGYGLSFSNWFLSVVLYVTLWKKGRNKKRNSNN